MLHPYHRAPPARAPCAIDRWLGAGWRLLERHALDAAAPPEQALRALAELRLRELPAVRVLFALRGLRSAPDASIRDFFSAAPFVLLDEEPGRELVAGVLLPPRAADRPRRTPRSPAEFRDACTAAPVAAIVTFRSDPAAAGSRLWTETWVRTRGRLASRAFGAYWLAIGPWSAWIRRMLLRGAARACR